MYKPALFFSKKIIIVLSATLCFASTPVWSADDDSMDAIHKRMQEQANGNTNMPYGMGYGMGRGGMGMMGSGMGYGGMGMMGSGMGYGGMGMMGSGMGYGGMGMMGSGMGYGGMGMMGGGMGYGGMGMMGHGMGYGGMGMMGHGMGMWRLNKEQRAEVRKLLRQQRAVHFKLMNEMMIIRDELMDKYDEDVLDAKAIGKIYARMFEQQRKMIEQSIETRNKIRSILSKEQKGDFDRMHHGSGMMGGMGMMH